MLNLAEYRKKPQSLADFLPWAALVAPGVVLNKDGCFSARRGFAAPISIARRKPNSSARRRGSTTCCGGSALAGRSSSRRSVIPRKIILRARFPTPISALVDMERKAQFEEEGGHFESGYFLTLLFLPAEDDAAGAEGWLYEGRSSRARQPRRSPASSTVRPPVATRRRFCAGSRMALGQRDADLSPFLRLDEAPHVRVPERRCISTRSSPTSR